MKKLFKTVLLFVLTVIAASAFAASASALSFDSENQWQTDKSVTLWSKKEYEGSSKEFGIGEYPSVDFFSMSIEIPQEYIVYAYSGENFTGDEYVFSDSQKSYLRYDFGIGVTFIKGIKSMKVGIIESEAIDITALDDAKKNQIMIDYAPRIWMAEGEPYGAASLEFVYDRFERVADDDGQYRLVMKDEMSSPFEIIDLFYGDHENSAAYAFWIEKDGGYIDISYFQYCPFDSGKYIWLLNCMVGAHPGDWEHFTIRFITYEKNGRQYMRPVKAAFPAHTFAVVESWETLEKYDDTHSEIYCAAGSHGMYPHAGDHVYTDVIILKLVDECSKGEAWDLWKPGKLETFEHVPMEGSRALAGSKWAEAFGYDVKNPDGIAVHFWGDKSSFPPFFNGGPEGPQYKSELKSETAFK